MIEDNMKPGHEHNHGIGCHQTHKHQQQHKGKPPSHKNPTVQKSSTNKLLMNYYVYPLPPGTYWKYLKVIWLLMRVCFLHDRPSEHLPCTQDSCIKKGAGWTPGRNKIKYENILVPVPGWGCWHFRGTKRLVFFIQAAGLSAKWHPSKPIIMFHLKCANASRFVWLAFA